MVGAAQEVGAKSPARARELKEPVGNSSRLGPGFPPCSLARWARTARLCSWYPAGPAHCRVTMLRRREALAWRDNSQGHVALL